MLRPVLACRLCLVMNCMLGWLFSYRNTRKCDGKLCPLSLLRGHSQFPAVPLGDDGRLAFLKKDDNLLCRFHGKEMKFDSEVTKSNLLHSCLIYASSLISSNVVSEPKLLTEDHPKYRLLFEDNYHQNR